MSLEVLTIITVEHENTGVGFVSDTVEHTNFDPEKCPTYVSSS